MRRHRWQVVRALRVLLACLVVTLSPGPSGAARVWTETPVLIAHASAASVASTAGRGAPQAALQASALAVSALAAAPAAWAPAPLAEASRPPAGDILPVEDRYLRNCTLLR
jgi:hypothetical protein